MGYGVDERNLEYSSDHREETGLEDALTDKGYPAFEQDEVQGRMDVGGPVGNDGGDGQGRQVEADAFIYPDGLGSEEVETKRKGEE